MTPLARRCTLVLLLVASIRAVAGDVPLEIQEEVVRYPVPGHDLEALRAALQSQSLAEKAGGSHGRTYSRIRIRYAPEPVDGGCRARDAGVSMRITTTLPEWQPREGTGTELLDRWEAVATALQRHESQHREHALAAARDLQAAIGGMGVQPDCTTLRREIDRASMRARMKAQFRDARYDARTRNGLEEGIAL